MENRPFPKRVIATLNPAYFLDSTSWLALSRRPTGSGLLGRVDVPPEFVVEIMSPTNSWEEMRRKLQESLDVGVDTVWVVEPANRAVQVYRDVDQVQTLGEDDVLTGDGPLDGVTIDVSALFA